MRSMSAICGRSLQTASPHFRALLSASPAAYETCNRTDVFSSFEQYADGRRTPSISSRRNSRSGSRRASSSAGVAGRKLSQGGLGGISAFGLSQGLSKLSDVNAASKDTSAFDEEDDEELDKDVLAAMEADEEAFDGAIRILPGVRQMIDAIPEGKYAVATSSARTYAYGAMERVGITPPAVTITAEHPELKRGKPHPDPFLLAAKKLGYDPTKCLVVEDSPSGIKAAVASGGITIAVCTSHTYQKVCDLGESEHVLKTESCCETLLTSIASHYRRTARRLLPRPSHDLARGGRPPQGRH